MDEFYKCALHAKHFYHLSLCILPATLQTHSDIERLLEPDEGE